MKSIDHKYEILKTLGEGGFGTVYLAKHVDLEDLYAIKVLRKEIQDSEELVQRFKREASVIKRLLHPNSVTLRDFGKLDDGFYMAMDYCEGDSLDKIIDKNGPIPYERVLCLIIQMLEVLGEAHRLGIIHRDLKPENIILEKENSPLERAKILDFGIAKLRESLGEKVNTLTKEGNIIGTPMFMSPEQAEAEELDERSDVYSLGMVMYSMLTGKAPFNATNIVQVIRKQVFAHPDRFKEIDSKSNIPIEVEQIVFQAIQKEKENRFQNTLEFKKACLTFLENKRLPDFMEQNINLLFQDKRGDISEKNTLDMKREIPTKIEGNPFSSQHHADSTGTSKNSFIGRLAIGSICLILLTLPFFYDHTPPELWIKSPQDGYVTNKKFVQITLKITDRSSNLKVIINGKEMEVTSSPYYTTKPIPISRNIINGQMKFRIKAEDSHGNQSKEKILLLIVDRKAPTITITKLEDDFIWKKKHLDIQGTVKEDYSLPISLWIQNKPIILEGNSGEKIGVFKAHLNLRRGRNIIRLRTKDSLGNESKKTIEVVGEYPCPIFQVLRPQNQKENGSYISYKKTVVVKLALPEDINRVIIQDKRATKEKGIFSGEVVLREGENKISIKILDNFDDPCKHEMTIFYTKK